MSMLGGIGLIRGIMAKMDWLDQNQRIIAENVANADTPGYTPRTLAEGDFKSALGNSLTGGKSKAPAQLTMAATDARHMGAAAPGQAKTTRQRTVYESSPDNNGVVLEEQLLKANENSINYQIATTLYRRNVGMLRMALQGSGR